MRRTVQLAIRGYKRWLSPMLPVACRYVPTCSDYAEEAVERFGVVRGGAMAVWRLLRCHPFGGSGYDPVVSTKWEVRSEKWEVRSTKCEVRSERCADRFHVHKEVGGASGITRNSKFKTQNC
jgi:putative membrane protein insertion efficiency factor